jgi:RNA polymerase sigma-70 factor (ECF subfamily)
MENDPVNDPKIDDGGGADPAALAELDRYRSWLVVLARLQVDARYRGKLDPSDIAQQSMLEAVRAWPQFRGRTGAELAAWLRQILARVLLHEMRRYGGTLKRDPRREVSLEQALQQSSQRLGDLLEAPGSSPSAHAERHEWELRLAEVLAGLPADYAEVILLRNVEGLSHEQVAQRMGRSAGAVRMLWVRALAALRGQLGENESASGRP